MTNTKNSRAKNIIETAAKKSPRATSRKVWLADVAAELSWRGSMDALAALAQESGVSLSRCDLVGAFDAAKVAAGEASLYVGGRRVSEVHFVDLA